MKSTDLSTGWNIWAHVWPCKSANWGQCHCIKGRVVWKFKQNWRRMCEPACRLWNYFFFFIFELDCAVESVLQGRCMCVSLRNPSSWSPLWESLAIKLTLLSHTTVSVPHLSAQPQGPLGSPSTPGFSPSVWLQGSSCWLLPEKLSQINQKEARECESEKLWEGKKRSVGKCVCDILVLVVMVLTPGRSLSLCTYRKTNKQNKCSLSVSFSVPIPMSLP